jgi:hypothetical protein
MYAQFALVIAATALLTPSMPRRSTHAGRAVDARAGAAERRNIVLPFFNPRYDAVERGYHAADRRMARRARCRSPSRC